MLQSIRKISKSGQFAAIYTNDADTSSFIFGRVIVTDDKYLAIQPVTQDGEADGILIKLCDDVFRIDIGGRYVERMKKLMNHYNVNLVNYNIDEKNIVDSIMDIAKHERCVMSIELEKSGIDDITGFVKEYNQEGIVLDVIDSFGSADGISSARKASISQISYNGKNEKRIMILAQETKQ